METALYFIHYGLLLAYGTALSLAFAGLSPNRKTAITFAGLFIVCGLAQLIVSSTMDEQAVWLLYPALVHIPIVVVLCIAYRKRLVTALASVATAYLLCQPAKWFGVFTYGLTESACAELAVRIVILLVAGALTLKYAAESLAALYDKEASSVLLFGSIPFVYYLFDYSVSVYGNYWGDQSAAVMEFMPLFLSLAFVVFCVAYHKTYQEKTESEHRAQLIRIEVEQQAREVDAIRKSESEIRLLRHDMRHILSNISLCLEEGDVQAAQAMLSEYIDSVEGTAVKRYCKNDVVNYVISDCAQRCESEGIAFTAAVEAGELHIDELMFSSIMSNALENARNAQRELPEDQRQIKLSLKVTNGRLLLSVRNSFAGNIKFVEGMPVSRKQGHGYGTKSIRYMAEKLGGTCQFAAEDNQFVTRVIIDL